MAQQRANPIAAARSYWGVDDGHWGIKVVDEQGNCFVVPSRAREGRHLIQWQEDSDQGGFYVTEEGRTYTADENLADYEDTRFKDYPRSELNRVLVHHALAAAGAGGKDVIITTGLPVSYFYQVNGEQNHALITAKIANLGRGVTCGAKKLAHIVENHVATEAIAAFFDQAVTLDGRAAPGYAAMQEAVVGVIDVGGKTTDCAVLYPGGQTVDVSRSGSSDIGVLNLNSWVSQKLLNHFQLDNLPPRLVEHAVRQGRVKIAGKEEDVADLVDIEKERLCSEILSAIRTKIGSGRDLDMVLIVGGGALVLGEHLARHFPHSRIPDLPQFANARGMLKIAKHVMKFGTE